MNLTRKSAIEQSRTVKVDMLDLERAAQAIRRQLDQAFPTMQVACALAGTTVEEIELAKELVELQGSALLEDDDEQDPPLDVHDWRDREREEWEHRLDDLADQRRGDGRLSGVDR